MLLRKIAPRTITAEKEVSEMDFDYFGVISTN
jgi:hypothetical protein